MSDNYLWDKSGNDDVVERLETLMQPYALKAAQQPPMPAPSPRKLMMAAMAAAVLVAVVLQAVRHEPRQQTPALTADKTFEYALGKITAERGSRVREISNGDQLIKLFLEQGTVHAQISAEARPRLFQVETPATTCVDLGCKYTLTVDAAGRSVVHVETGRVAFVDGDREVYVPRDASCRAAKGRGPGTPIFDDASPGFVKAVQGFDDARHERRRAAASHVASSARVRDSLSLWHFLTDADREIAKIGLAALQRLAPFSMPDADTLKRDKYALDMWKEHLEAYWR